MQWQGAGAPTMEFSMKIKRKGADFLPKLQKNLRKIQRGEDQECAVGFPMGKGAELKWYDSGESILQVALQNEFGVPEKHIPARPFMQTAAPEIQEAYEADCAKAAEALLSGKMKMYKFLDIEGQKAVDIIQETIFSGEWIPNAEETIRRKKSSKPLIDSAICGNS